MAPKPPAPLIDHIAQGKCVLFAGAGLSMQAGLPSWPALLRGIVDDLPNLRDEESEELGRLLARSKLLDVAEYSKLKDNFQFNAVLEERLRGADCEVPEAHRLVARIPFAGVVTTNYDKLLERAWRLERSGEPKVLTHLDAPALGKLLLGGDYFVLKAHGDIDRPKSIVLTAKDYQEVIHSNSAFESVFAAILLTRVILFVGYSLNDPDFGLLLERPLRRFEGLVPPRYALMTDIGPIEADVLYRTSGVQVIPYGNADGKHQEVIGFLKQLEEETAAAQERSAAARDVAGVAAKKAPVAAKKVPVAKAYEAVADAAQQVNIELNYDGARVLSTLSHGRDRTFGSARAMPDWRGLRTIVQSTMKAWDGKPSSVTPLSTALTEMIDDGIVEYLGGLADDTVVHLRIGRELQDLPWEWIRVPGAADPQILSLRNPVVRQPLGASDSQVYAAGFGSPLHVLLVADTTAKMALPGAREEAERIGAMFGQKGAQVTLLIGAEATYQNLAESLRSHRYDVIHFAGHAWFDAQTSYLMLANEEVLRAPQLADLIRSAPPAVLFLNSHFTSFVPRGMEDVAVKPAGETFSSTGSGYLGFSQIAADTGTGAFLGTCHDALSDVGAKEIAVRVFEELLDGARIATALLSASRTAAADGITSEGLLYSLVGSAHLRLAQPR